MDSRMEEARRAIEAVLMAATEPIDARTLAQLLELPTKQVRELCSELAGEYVTQERGFMIAEVAGGYRFQTAPDMSAYVERFVVESQRARLSAPAMETLAIIAYKQPLSRAQVSAIRGVNVDSTIDTLLERGYICVVGQDRGPGSPTLFGTSQKFMEKLGLSSLEDLPPIAEFIPDSHVVELLERGLRVGDPLGELEVTDQSE